MAILIQYANGVPGVKFLLDKSEITIGRGLDNDISIDDEFVSKTHAVIQLIQDELTNKIDCVLIDNDSTNHTYVNNTQVSAHRLEERDKIFIGQNEFRFVEESGPVAELGQTVSGFFDDEAPGLIHAELSKHLSHDGDAVERAEKAELVTTRVENSNDSYADLPVEGYEVDEVSDTKLQIKFATESLNDENSINEKSTNNEELLSDKNNKRFSRRLSLI